MTDLAARIDDIGVRVYEFPTPEPEADGTLSWSSTTAVVVTVRAGSATGLGWTYSSPAAATLIHTHLKSLLDGENPFDIGRLWISMRRACRNLVSGGLVMQAVSAVDIALWDLKARLLAVPLAVLFGTVRSAVPLYGSGGFTTLTDRQLAEQVDTWSAAGCTAMKIKIGEAWGSRLGRDLERVHRLRALAGPDIAVMVDANGGYTVGQARRIGRELDAAGVVWFEEPVSSENRAGLAALRSALDCDVAAGEYISDLAEAAELVEVVDCLQLDVTRCGGYTGWFRAAALAEARGLQVSGHCAPALHASAAVATSNLRHIEWFADHARLEPELVEGIPPVSDGALGPVTDAAGHGLRLRRDAQRFRV